VTRAVNGLRAWLLQRVSALYLIFFTLFLVLHFLFNPPGDYAQWRAWVAAPAVGSSVAVFFAMLLIHMWVGLRDVIIDYVHPFAVRLSVLALVALALLGAGAWAALILARTLLT
jgi:succinate dehydrogenase / fumarate reductase membrane anchor subunit